MRMVVDVGNTNVKFGFYNDGKCLYVLNTTTFKEFTVDEYFAKLKSIFSNSSIALDGITSCFISSVVPEVNRSLALAIKKLVGVTPNFLEMGIKTGISVKVKSPHEVGSDLISAVAGSVSKQVFPAIIVGIGTATTFTVVNSNKEIIGIAISPGLEISRMALADKTSLLKQIELKTPDSVLGRNTTESMQSGIIFGHASMIDGMIERIIEDVGVNMPTIAFGGLSRLIVPICKAKIVVDENLILNGLNHIGGLNYES